MHFEMVTKPFSPPTRQDLNLPGPEPMELVLDKPIDSKQAGGYIQADVDIMEQRICGNGMPASK